MRDFRSRGGQCLRMCGVAALCWTTVTDCAAQAPTANPARPTMTNPATLPPVGYLQLEQGYLGSLDSPATDSQHGVNLVAKTAVYPRLMLEVQSQPWARSREIGETAPENGSGDVLLGAQTVLYNPPEGSDDAVKDDVHRHAYVRSARPTIALAYLNRVYSGSTPDIDIGSQSRTLVALFSGHAPGIDVHYDVNVIASEQPGESTEPDGHMIRRAQFGQTFSVDRPLGTDALQFSLELYHFTQPLVHASSDGRGVVRANMVDGLFALSYSVRPNIVIDGGFAHGFTSTSTRWQSFAGVTYVLPYRLWPGRKS
jgi:hypothetical protein